MTYARFFTCIPLLAAVSLASSQAVPPTSYSLTQAVNGGAGGVTNTVYRSGTKVLTVVDYPVQGTTPASRAFTLYNLEAKTTFSWDPAATPVSCSAGNFSGDWGDPFGMTAEVNAGIAKGELKPAGTDTIAGVPVQVYAATSAQGSTKAWLDTKAGLVMRAVLSAPGAAPMTMIDVKKVSFAPPPASMFVLPPPCAGAKAPPTAAELIADETGDDAANYVNGMYGPGSKDTCTVVLRVVEARTMTPITKIQVAIDTGYKQENPPHYEFGVSDSGTTSYSGGNVREITSQVHKGVVRISNPPPYFMLGVNVIHPHHGGDLGLVYRQCFAPTTVLLLVVKDYGQDSESGDFLWVKGGKNAVAPVP